MCTTLHCIDTVSVGDPWNRGGLWRGGKNFIGSKIILLKYFLSMCIQGVALGEPWPAKATPGIPLKGSDETWESDSP